MDEQQSDKISEKNDIINDFNELHALPDVNILHELTKTMNSYDDFINQLGIDKNELLECNIEGKDDLNDSDRYLFVYFNVLKFCIVLRYYMSKSESKQSDNKELLYKDSFYEMNESLNNLILLKDSNDYLKVDYTQISLDIKHPLIYAIKKKFEPVQRFIKYNFNEDKYNEYDISGIISTQILSELNFNISINNSVFCESEYVNKKLILHNIYNMGKLYDISSLRFIEKIEKVMHDHTELKEIKVAIFGETNVDCLNDYLSKEYPEKNFYIDEYRFAEKKGAMLFKKNEEFINLYSFDDLKKLFGQYHLILLLDNGCFYDVKQTKVTNDIYNYYSYLKNIDKVNIGDLYDSKSPASIKKLFNYLSMSYYSFLTGESYQLEYDHILFNVLLSCVGSQPKSNAPDVYAFISQERDTIGNRNLSDYCYCKDEYYNGKKATVVKFPNSNELNYELSDDLLLVNKYGEKTVIYTFSAWKLYKSLDIKYAEEHVCCLNKLSILCEFTYGSNIQIKYDVKTCNNEKPDCKGQVEAVIDYLLKVVFKNRDSIVSEYLDNLFLSILLSNAESIEAIFFVYLLKCKRKELPDFNIQKIVSDETLENKDSKNKYTYKQKKMLLMIMENIGDLVLHQEVDKKSYIMSDIFNNYSSHIVPETMLKIILTIKELCLYFGFTEDIIYNNVSVFEEE